MQEEERGQIYQETELWVERLVQLCKRKTRYRATTQPELVCAKFLATNSALDLLAIRYPSVKTFDSWVPGYRAQDMTGEAVDDADNGTRMIQKGKAPTTLEWEEQLRDAVSKYIDNNPEEGWEEADLVYGTDADRIAVYVHTMACLRDDEIVTSVEHGRSKTRESHHVQVMKWQRSTLQMTFTRVHASRLPSRRAGQGEGAGRTSPEYKSS